MAATACRTAASMAAARCPDWAVLEVLGSTSDADGQRALGDEGGIEPVAPEGLIREFTGSSSKEIAV